MLFEVYGLEDSYDYDLVYSIYLASYESFLGNYVSDYTRERFKPESLLAHFLWELATFGFGSSKQRSDRAHGLSAD